MYLFSPKTPLAAYFQLIEIMVVHRHAGQTTASIKIEPESQNFMLDPVLAIVTHTNFDIGAYKVTAVGCKTVTPPTQEPLNNLRYDTG